MKNKENRGILAKGIPLTDMQPEAMLFVLKMAGFKEYFGIDINPERMPVEKAVEINSFALNAMNERINALPVEKIIESYFDPENNRGEIEMMLIKNRCGHNR